MATRAPSVRCSKTPPNDRPRLEIDRTTRPAKIVSPPAPRRDRLALGAREQHPPTAAMSQATQGGAASPQDVQSQNRGGPTAAQQAEGARRPGSENLAELQAALNEARGLDRSGKESDCMDAVQRAKRLAG